MSQPLNDLATLLNWLRLPGAHLVIDGYTYLTYDHDAQHWLLYHRRPYESYTHVWQRGTLAQCYDEYQRIQAAKLITGEPAHDRPDPQPD